MFKIGPETKAQGNGVALSALLGLAVGYFLDLSFIVFSVSIVVSMLVLGFAFGAIDAMRASAGQAPVSHRTLFHRGLMEGFGGLLIALAFSLLARAV